MSRLKTTDNMFHVKLISKKGTCNVLNKKNGTHESERLHEDNICILYYKHISVSFSNTYSNHEYGF